MARYREISFAMLTRALPMILCGVLVKTRPTGSTDGFNVGDVTVLGIAVDAEARTDAVWWMALACAAVASVLVSACLVSVAGSASAPLRENEVRVEYLGVSATRLAHLKTTVAGMPAGVGGAPVAMSVGHVGPFMSCWTTSDGFVFAAILAGPASAPGAFVAAFLFGMARTIALALFPGGWPLILGCVPPAVILFTPNGIVVLLVVAAQPV